MKTDLGILRGSLVPATDGQDSLQVCVVLLEGREPIVGALAVVVAQFVPRIQDLQAKERNIRLLENKRRRRMELSV